VFEYVKYPNVRALNSIQCIIPPKKEPYEGIVQRHRFVQDAYRILESRLGPISSQFRSVKSEKKSILDNLYLGLEL
jgi:hypothetical protein